MRLCRSGGDVTFDGPDTKAINAKTILFFKYCSKPKRYGDYAWCSESIATAVHASTLGCVIQQLLNLPIAPILGIEEWRSPEIIFFAMIRAP